MLAKSKVKYIQSLGQKKYRDETGLFIAEGPRIVEEWIREVPDHVLEVYATEKWNRDQVPGAMLSVISEDELKRISQMASPNQVLAVVKQFVRPAAISREDRLILALDSIQDPGNFGTILRIADWFGIGQVVCNHGCADLYNPKVVQAGMGSIARVKVYYTDLASWLDASEGMKVYAAVLDGQDPAKLSGQVEGVLVIGNEARGISENVMEHVDVKLTIPRKGRAESLNAAVATGILLSHLVK